MHVHLTLVLAVLRGTQGPSPGPLSAWLSCKGPAVGVGPVSAVATSSSEVTRSCWQLCPSGPWSFSIGHVGPGPRTKALCTSQDQKQWPCAGPAC